MCIVLIIAVTCVIWALKNHIFSKEQKPVYYWGLETDFKQGYQQPDGDKINIENIAFFKRILSIDTVGILTVDKISDI